MERITAEVIREALRKRFCQPEWELVEEVDVGNNRRADAIAVNMWFSRGYEVIGFEIKVSRSDLRKELQDVSKAEPGFKKCDKWMLVTPKGLVNDSLLIPEPWGIMEYHNGMLKIKKQPERHERELTKAFSAHLLRAMRSAVNANFADELDKEVQKIRDDYEQNYYKRKEEEQKRYRNTKEEDIQIILKALHDSNVWKINYEDLMIAFSLMYSFDNAKYNIKYTISQLKRAQKSLEELEKCMDNGKSGEDSNEQL